MMNITVSVGGRFHAFYLARQLLKRGCLLRLITSYPKFEVAKYGIPKNKVSSVIIKELMFRGWQALPSPLRGIHNPQYLIHEIYDRWASCLYPWKSDICVAFSSFALHTLRKAKDMGAVTIVERGSSHILYQERMLKEECLLTGVKPQRIPAGIIEKELREYREADYISIPSLFVKRTFLENGVAQDKLIHVPYGVDLGYFRQIPKKDNVFRIIYCGGISLRKGVHYLLQAFSELDLPHSELWLIGRINEEMLPYMKKFASAKVVHKGPYRQEELYKYYSQGSVFVMMSVEEGLAMVQPQAMACGLPVVCTRNTGGEDIIRDGLDGFIINIRDLGALKEKIRFLYENPSLREEMGRSARERVANGFSWDDYGNRITEAYSNIIGA